MTIATIRSKRIKIKNLFFRSPFLLLIVAVSVCNNMQSGIAQAAKSAVLKPWKSQPYQLLKKKKLSKDSFLLRYGLPEGRSMLGVKPDIPTCIKVKYQPPAETGHKALAKSYSPVSHPSQSDYFELVVKAYPYQEGGGVGKYLCDMEIGSSIEAQLKPERIMHDSPNVLGRGWKNIGLVAGGTGIAPLLQVARIALESNGNEENIKVHLLFINHTFEDVLGKDEIEALARDHPDNFFVTYSFTRETEDATGGGNDDGACPILDGTSKANFTRGKGDASMAAKALPKPSNSGDTMVLVCGRDGFVAHWGGPVGRAPTEDGSKGPKIQGPLLGVLKDAGFTAEQVFKY